jgi:hypothetical protein
MFHQCSPALARGVPQADPGANRAANLLWECSPIRPEKNGKIACNDSQSLLVCSQYVPNSDPTVIQALRKPQENPAPQAAKGPTE